MARRAAKDIRVSTVVHPQSTWLPWRNARSCGAPFQIADHLGFGCKEIRLLLPLPDGRAGAEGCARSSTGRNCVTHLGSLTSCIFASVVLVAVINPPILYRKNPFVITPRSQTFPPPAETPGALASRTRPSSELRSYLGNHGTVEGVTTTRQMPGEALRKPLRQGDVWFPPTHSEASDLVVRRYAARSDEVAMLREKHG